VKAKSQGEAGQRLRLTDLGELSTLRCLDLSRNHLAALPPGCFAGWTRMERLWLSHNQLLSVADQLLPRGEDMAASMAPALTELHLDHNRLDGLPAELARLTRLRVLALQENDIPELPAQLGNLTQLERLEVGTQNGRLRYFFLLFSFCNFYQEFKKWCKNGSGPLRKRWWRWGRAASWHTWASCSRVRSPATDSRSCSSARKTSGTQLFSINYYLII
jgi:hypothetical protein